MSTTTTTDEALLRASDVAEMLSVEQTWVYREARAGRIPCVKLGRNIRFRRSSIEDWVRRIEEAGA